MGILQESLSEYELALNPAKTRIVELPVANEVPWIHELREASFRDTPVAQSTDLMRYFDLAYSLAASNPDAHVLNYAIARLRSVMVLPSNWSVFQHLLFQAWLGEAKTFQPVLVQLLFYKSQGMPINTVMLSDAINVQVQTHALLGHSSEVAWALWAAKAFAVCVSAAAAAEVSRSSDSVVALLALDLKANGLIPGTLDTSVWTPAITTEELYGPQWLLAYEAGVKGWLPSLAPVVDHIAADPFFSALRANGVYFYDATKTTLPLITMTTGPAIGGGGGGGTY
jgi:hypothetical protein